MHLLEEEPTDPTCQSPNWKGDGYCDDENNNPDCEWDGGDCCGPNVKKDYCYLCACLDPNTDCTDTCAESYWKG